MKNFIKTIIGWSAVGFGLHAGMWLWNEVVADKAYDLKDLLSEKFSKEEGA